MRVPTFPADVPLAYPSDTHHIVVLRNDRYFEIDTKGRGKKELAQAFRDVKRMADGHTGSGLGILTADDRDVWTEVSEMRTSLADGDRHDDTSYPSHHRTQPLFKRLNPPSCLSVLMMDHLLVAITLERGTIG